MALDARVPASEPARPGSLRGEQTDLTRRRILDAVVQILAGNVADLSVEAVSRASGVSRPTIYRYFRGKREMVTAVGELYAQQTGVADASDATTFDQLLAHVPDIFARYDTVAPELRAAAMQIGRLEDAEPYRVGRVSTLRAMLAQDAPHVPEEDLERLAQILTVLLSSGMLRSLRHYLDLTPEAAGALVVWTVRRLISAGEKETP